VTNVVAAWIARLAGTGMVLGIALLAGAPVARADPAADAVARLGAGSVYVAPGVTGVTLDSGLAAALPTDLKIAVLPVGAGQPSTLAAAIARGLGASAKRPLTIGVLTVAAGRQISLRATSSKYCPGAADEQAQAAGGAGRAQVQRTGDLTVLIQDFARRLEVARVDRGDCPSAAGDRSGGSTGWMWIGAIALLGAGGIGGLLVYRRRRQQRELDLARTRTTPYYDRLANDINTVDPKDDARAQQALADAAERFTSAGSLLATADTVEKYGVARQTVLEGLFAIRTARESLGIDPGPELPAPARSTHDQLAVPQHVSVQGRQYQGYPNYTPGAPYYYGGGGAVPGGWYQTPFWETMLLGSVLSGTLLSYGGYDGAGWDAGPGADTDHGGGDFGAGGDVGVGGDFDGGGDFGGGGGDFGS